jgi:hypothetical protein
LSFRDLIFNVLPDLRRAKRQLTIPYYPYGMEAASSPAFIAPPQPEPAAEAPEVEAAT